MRFLKLNISKMKNIKVINVENTNIPNKSLKYLQYFNNLKIKILISQSNSPYQIFLAGSTISGKTCYYRSLLGLNYSNNICSNCACDYTIINPSFNKNIQIELWDSTRWDDPYISLVGSLCSLADGILLLFDVTSKRDFNNLNYILEKIKSFCDDSIPILLIANKIDLYEEREVDAEDIRKFQYDNNLIGYFEVSCIDEFNVKDSFDFLVKYLIENTNKNIDINNSI